ncbi:hypothetical protein IV203_032115 [Nitzschia inconspicua]|uniref:Uncharacterized protein n=1 Tax=Nitzschia inconspicua TaxID=303405 RepID=A0A9K3Q314_9STRA|nr:hypothetical protein IV203_032115 [Nitzschia inconspicua]
MQQQVASTSQQPQPQQHYVLDALEDLGVHVLQPVEKRDVKLAECFGRFASFCLDPEIFSSITLPLLQQHMENGLVGELQGGNENSSIYRVSIVDENKKETGPVPKLFDAFLQSHPQYESILTISRLQEYILQMCNDSRRQQQQHCQYSQLGNLMFILSNGPITGQVRHIDHMDPNVQVCLYLSEQCPATIVYELQEPNNSASITNCQELLEFWGEEHGPVPKTVTDVMVQVQNIALEQHPTFSYFASWKSVSHHLRNFGKLYQHVARPLALLHCTPGTTLLAQGNQVHAGPPCQVPRMFAFCIGIPDDDDAQENTNSNCYDDVPSVSLGDNKEDQNGELQYNPVLLHVDLCSILFAVLQPDDSTAHTNLDDDDTTMPHSKRYLLHMLPSMILEYPHETYARLIDDRREELRQWLGELVEAVTAAKAKMGHGKKENHFMNGMGLDSNWLLFNDARVCRLIDQAAITINRIFDIPTSEEHNGRKKSKHRKTRQKTRQTRLFKNRPNQHHCADS